MRNTEEETKYWHLWSRLPSLCVLFVLLTVSFGYATSPDMSNWTAGPDCRVNTTTTEALTNFPVRCDFNTSNTTLWNHNCTNVRFTDANDTTMLMYDLDSNSTLFCRNETNNATFWILANTSDSSVEYTVIHTWLGFLTVPSGEHSNAVWNNTGGADYYSVWHFNDGTDEIGNNNMFLRNGTTTIPTTGPNTGACRAGFCVNISAYNYLEANAVTAVYPINYDPSYFSIWSYRNSSACPGAYNDPTLFAFGAAYNHARTFMTRNANLYNYGGVALGSPITNGCGANYLEFYSAIDYGQNAHTIIKNSTSVSFTSAFGTTQALVGDHRLRIGNMTDANGVPTTWFQGDESGTFDEGRFAASNRTLGWALAEYQQTWSVGAPPVAGFTATLLTPSDGSVYPLNQTSIPISFNCSGDSASYLANLTVNNASYNNATEITALNGTSTAYTINMPSDTNGSFVWGVVCYNSTDSVYSSNFTFSITNTAPVIEELSISPNGTVKLLGPLWFNITVSHQDSTPIIIAYSWLKNGVNQTTLSSTLTVLNNTRTVVNNTATPFTLGDNWSVVVFATDGENSSATNSTSNTTVSDYVTNVTTNYTSSQIDIYQYPNYLNLSMTGASDVNSVLNIGGVNHTVTKTTSGSMFYFVLNAYSGQVSYPSSVEYIWFYTTSLSNGSSVVQNTSYNVSVEPGGLVVCNDTNTMLSLNYTVKDFTTGNLVNTTYTSSYVGVVNRSQTGVNTNYSWCIYPNNGSLDATIYETYTAAGYAPLLTQRTLTATNTTAHIVIYLSNTTLAYPTTLSLQQLPNIPLVGQTISVSRYDPPSNYTFIQSCVTGVAGTCLVYLVPNSVYYFYNLSGVSTTVGPEVLTCSVSTGACYRNFFVGSVINIPSVQAGTTTGSCVYSNTTGYITCTGLTTASEVTGFGLILYQSGANTSTCLNETLGASVSLTCGVPQTNNTVWNYALYTTETVSNELVYSGVVRIDLNRTASLGRDSWFIMLFLFVFLAAVGAAHPVLGIIFGIMGLLLPVFVQIVPFNAVSSIIILSGVTGGVLIWRMRV